MKQFVIIILALSMLLTFTFTLSAQELTALEILQKSDAVGMAAKDKHSLSTMILIDKDGDQKERKTEVFERNKEDLRLVRFLSPADQKGISFLNLPDDKMYLYLPAFRKIRTIASHVKNESFAGTDFSYDDMSASGYAEDYTPALRETTAEFYVLELTPKPESEKDYSKMILRARKDNFFAVKMEYYDKGGNLWKVMEQRQLEKKGDYWVALEVEMSDLKTNHRTKVVTDSIELDSGLSDEIFTQRNLKKSE
jgi:outer membrane lipoprotein-sorting protein